MDGAGAGPWRYTLANATAGAEFLKQQNDAAVEVGTTIQYCMNLPCTVLQSTQLQAVSHAREAKDHVRDPLVHSWKEGLSGLLLDSVGLGASIDNIFTSGIPEAGCGGFNCSKPLPMKSNANSCQSSVLNVCGSLSLMGLSAEMNPRYETALAALSGGPYAVSDGNGLTDKEMVMHSCRADGAILRTTEQMAMLDAGLREGFVDLVEFDIWTAATVIREDRWTFVLSTFLPRVVALTPVDLGYPRDADLIGWDKWSSLDAPGLHGELRVVDAATPLTLRACPHLENPRDKNYIYTIVAPRPCAGCWALLGELDKVASVSGVRFEEVQAAATSLTVRGIGVAGEVLSLGAVAPSSTAQLTLSVASVTVDASGRFIHSWHSSKLELKAELASRSTTEKAMVANSNQ